MRTSYPTLRALHRELRRGILKEATKQTKKHSPKIVKSLQENFIRHISTNDYFTVRERRVLAEYFKQNSSLNEAKFMQVGSRVLLSESVNTRMNEGFFDWLGGLWKKIKNAFGSIKEMVQKIIADIKKFVGERATEAYNFAVKTMNSIVGTLDQKLKSILKGEEIKEGESKKIDPEVAKKHFPTEAKHLAEVVTWIGNTPARVVTQYMGETVETDKVTADIEKKMDSAASEKGSGDEEAEKKVEKGSGGLQESSRRIRQELNERSLFDAIFTKMLVEEEEGGELPSDVMTNPQSTSKWKKFGKKALHVLEFILEAVAALLNPAKYLLLQAIQSGSNWIMDKGAKAIQKLGGPAAIDYVVAPVILATAAKFTQLFETMTGWATEGVKNLLLLIPFAGAAAKIIADVAHYSMLILAIFHIVHAVFAKNATDKEMGNVLEYGIQESEKTRKNYIKNTRMYPQRVYALK